MRCVICGADHVSCGGPAKFSGVPVGAEVKRMAQGNWTSDRRLYTDVNGRAVEENDPSRAFLLVVAGGTLPMARARELGLVPGFEPKQTESAELVADSHFEETLANKDAEIKRLEDRIKTLESDIEDRDNTIAEKDAEIKRLTDAAKETGVDDPKTPPAPPSEEDKPEADAQKAKAPDKDKALKPGSNK